MATTLSNPLNDSFQLQDVVWAALEKIGSKKKNRDAIKEDSVHQVDLQLSGTVNGESFEQQLSSILSVGTDLQKATSAIPDLPKLIAVILGKLNRATRERLLQDIPNEFFANDEQIPACSDVIMDQTERMLRKLRREKQIQVKGPVRCEIPPDLEPRQCRLQSVPLPGNQNRWV